MSQCLILAGGLATRMRPLTEKMPKALIPIDHDGSSEPFIHYQLQWLAQHGVSEVVLCIGYKGELIREVVGNGAHWNLGVKYVDEGAELRGTGGAIRKALDEGVLEPEFLVTYGDAYLPVDFGDVLRAFGSQQLSALMTVFKNHGKWDSSNVSYENGRVMLYRKGQADAGMQYIDYGLLAFRRDLIEREIASGVREDLAPLLNRLSVRGQLAGYEVNTRFYEIGSLSGLEDFKSLVASSTEGKG